MKHPSNLFQLEVAASLAGVRALAIKIGFTLLLGFPFVVVAMPSRVKVSGLMMLLLFTSFFGAAVSIVRRRTDGRLGKLQLLPPPRWLRSLDLVLASAVVDLVQMGVVLVLYLVFNARGGWTNLLLRILALFVAGDLLLNLLGLSLGLALKSNAEVHLSAALSVGVIAVLSGLVPAPAFAVTFVAAISRYNPLSLLADSLLTAASQTAEGTSGPFAVGGLVLTVGLLVWRGVDWSALTDRAQ